MADDKGGILLPHHGKGKELQELLRKELGVPDSVVWFSVRFAVDETINVTCEYIAKEHLSNDGG